MLTAYEQYAAQTFDEAGIEVLLVGDSASNNVYGNETSLPVTVDELIPLTRAVSRAGEAGAGRRRPAVRLLPGLARAGLPHRRPVHEGGRRARVKLEGGVEMVPQIEQLTRGGIPVMAHIGFTPQSEHALGGYRVQGRGETRPGSSRTPRRSRTPARSRSSWRWSPATSPARSPGSCGSPRSASAPATRRDGQVLVWQDAFGLRTGRMAKFVKQYADVHGVLLDAARAYAADVKAGTFPGPEHTF